MRRFSEVMAQSEPSGSAEAATISCLEGPSSALQRLPSKCARYAPSCCEFIASQTSLAEGANSTPGDPRSFSPGEFGKVSTLAAATLLELGFTRATALDGGMKTWLDAELPVES